MSKEKKKIEYSLHHILPSSRWGQSNDINCEMIRKTVHRSIHTLFSNEIFPEQIIKLTNLSSKALKPEIVKELLEVLQYRDVHSPEERYKEECLWLPKHQNKIY